VDFCDLANYENRCVTLLRNSDTQHWIPFRPPTFGKSSTPYPETLPCQDDIDNCRSSTSTDGANMPSRNVDSTKSRLHIHTPGASAFGRKSTSPWIWFSAHGVRTGRLLALAPFPPPWPLGLLHPAPPLLAGLEGALMLDQAALRTEGAARADQPARRRLPGSRILLDLVAAVSRRASPLTQPSTRPCGAYHACLRASVWSSRGRG
jgi:hypothetical protein